MILITAPQMEALYWIIESVINKTDYKRYLHQRKKVFVKNVGGRTPETDGCCQSRDAARACLMMRGTATGTHKVKVTLATVRPHTHTQRFSSVTSSRGTPIYSENQSPACLVAYDCLGRKGIIVLCRKSVM